MTTSSRPANWSSPGSCSARSGEEVLRETRNFDSGTSLLRRDRVTFKVPDVTRRTRFTLDMTLRKNGKLRAARAADRRSVADGGDCRGIDAAQWRSSIRRARRKPSWSGSAARSNRCRRSRPRPWPTAACWSSARKASSANMLSEQEALQRFAEGRRTRAGPAADGDGHPARRDLPGEAKLLQHGFRPRSRTTR